MTSTRNAMQDSFSSENESFSDSDQDQVVSTKNSKLYQKDSEEEELENLVLGNRDSFRDNLFASHGIGEDEDEYNATEKDTHGLLEPDEAGLEEVQDADLFTFDVGPAGGIGSALQKPAVSQDGAQDVPAWADSDDDTLSISLADHTRLRKLRVTEAEDVVSGAEYTRRLRQQFLRLHPLPKWARDAEGRAKKQHSDPSRRGQRRSSNSSQSSRSSSRSGSESDGEVSAQPMEKFLRDVNKMAGQGQAKKRRLRPEVIDIQRTREIPDKHKAPVESLSFHPEFPVLLSCSTASILYLHHIAPEARPTPNPQLTSVQVKQVDTRRAEFLYPEGDKIVFAGRRKYFHQWDLQSGVVQKTTQILGHKGEHKSMEHFKLSPCGRYMGIVASTRKGGGIVNILSVGSMQWVTAARLSSHNGIADFAWWKTGDGLTILGRDGSVGEYSMTSRSFLGIWHDEGCIGGIVLALGGHGGPPQLGEDRWVAVGSNSGITNIYDRIEMLSTKNPRNQSAAVGDDDAPDSLEIKERPAPTRTFEQLVTPITVLAFSPDGQIFAFGSRHKKDALKLVHLPTCTVYRNWPTEQTPLGRITALQFGRQSDLLAVGNDTGKIRMWDIRR